MAPPVTLRPLAFSRIDDGATPVVVIYGPVISGLIANPASAADQTLSAVEPLYVDLLYPATVGASATTFVLQPGQSFTLPAGFGGRVTVNAASTGHSFAGYIVQEAADFKPLDGISEDGEGVFPPRGPTVNLEAIPSYLYQQYSDDDDLQAFVAAFNEMVGWYIDWFATLNPADYTQDHIQGPLLDWVGAGLYGMTRNALPHGIFRSFGTLNSYVFNQWPLNKIATIPPSDYQLTTDDIYRRILTWHLYKDDGDVFTIRWLKRRVKRFLTGTDGKGGDTHATADPAWAPDETYDISVTFGANNEVNINFFRTKRVFTGGALFNAFQLNQRRLNEYNGTAYSFTIHPLAPVFKAAVDAGVLELPFQFKFMVNIN